MASLLNWPSGLICFPGSHNTKTTSWLDPRLRDKASRALEECEDDGMLLHTNCQKKKNSI